MHSNLHRCIAAKHHVAGAGTSHGYMLSYYLVICDTLVNRVVSESMLRAGDVTVPIIIMMIRARICRKVETKQRQGFTLIPGAEIGN